MISSKKDTSNKSIESDNDLSSGIKYSVKNVEENVTVAILVFSWVKRIFFYLSTIPRSCPPLKGPAFMQFKPTHLFFKKTD